MRAIRLQARLRQVDVARSAGLSQAAISDIERGRLDRLSLRTVRSAAAALGAEVSLEIRWRGGELDRLLDQHHAELVSRTVGILERSDWTVVTEATYSRWGERGSFDVLALHRRTGTVLAVEVKTRLLSLEATLRKLDEKARVAPGVADDRFGTRPRVCGRMLVLPEGGVARRTIAEHDSVLRLVLPLRGIAAHGWLDEPTTSAGILLLVRPRTAVPLRGDRRRASPRRLAQERAPDPGPRLTLAAGPHDRRDPAPGDTRRPKAPP